MSNHLDPGLGDFQSAYYGANLARLVEVKRAYDTDDLFTFAQSIPTRILTGEEPEPPLVLVDLFATRTQVRTLRWLHDAKESANRA